MSTLRTDEDRISSLEQRVTSTVQRNCHIADARHGADDGMCTYLMKMREYFRWERGLPFDARLHNDDVGNWLCEREALWSNLVEQDFATITIDGQPYDPFDAMAINHALERHGLVYSAGLIDGGRPHFFVGRLVGKEAAADGFLLRIVDRELARGLTAPPAMTLGRTIFLRREALRRYVWQKYESWRWNRPDNAFGRAVACYPFDNALDEALDRMTADELASAREHEIGEYLAGRELGECWNDMLMALCGTPAELMARAVRDHIADCTRTLPMLVAQARAPSLHFFAGNLSAMRRDLFPSLLSAYEAWRASGDTQVLGRIAATGQEHWQAVAAQMLDLFRANGSGSAAPIADFVTARRL